MKMKSLTVPVLVALAAMLWLYTAATGEELKRGQSISGTLVKVKGNDVILRDGRSKVRTITLNDDTTVKVDGEPGTLDDLRPGVDLSIGTDGRAPQGVIRYEVIATSKRLIGKIGRVEGRTVVVKSLTINDDTEWRVETDENTKFSRVGQARPPQQLTIDELVVDEEVVVTPDTGVAKKVVLQARMFHDHPSKSNRR